MNKFIIKNRLNLKINIFMSDNIGQRRQNFLEYFDVLFGRRFSHPEFQVSDMTKILSQ